MEPQPHDLEYQGPGVPPSRRRQWTMFLAGLGGGLCVSLIYYLSLGNDVFGNTPAAPFGALALKLIAGITLVCFPRWRTLGLGLIASIPVAVLIFFGLCFAAIALN